ncbi:hypothetical protein HYALB_00006785 [Hymenoscyphus albidus]|uniref:C2H2-type domain-containing protein n=1 Tax=Hymenoscyphus albidus TaxID=595503 RepID=A0A9N9QD63_9HELO|nr:hypothetical protein HYALB_00006785 [Hymenoscyphus albidus]
MASSKEIQHSSRPVGQHRLSMSAAGSLPKSHSRNHSHSASSGSLIPSHRVQRRKSNANVSNVAAMVNAVRESGDTSLGMPISSRRNTMSKSASARSAALGSLPSPPASLPSHKMRIVSSGKSDRGESAIEDDLAEDMEEDEDDTGFKQSRVRRASEGQHLMKDGKKANGGDLKCDKCGKGYKHSSCLTKHLWEHTPEWSFTSKLLISKHQQVQLLEAASVLLTMNQGGTTPPDSAKDFQSDQDSASPAPSGSELNDRASSADTTPPPNMDVYRSGSHKRYSSGYGYWRSYQSASSAHSVNGESMPLGSDFGYHRQPSHERRPPSVGFNRNAEDDGLAAAVELLSCSFGSTGTPRTLPVTLPEDAPPVPHIPAQYLDGFSGTTLTHSLHPQQPESYTRHRHHLDEDVKMEESEESVMDDDDYDRRSRARSDEDDDGVFGRMEE